MKKMISMMLVFLMALGLLAGCGGKKADDSAPDVSQEADGAEADQGTASALGCLKSFSAGTLDGGTFTQEDIQAKDVTVINFWALTCGPCIVEMPSLAAFGKALPENVQLITVCLDGAGNEESAQSVLQDAGFEGVTLISGDGDLLDLSGNLMYTPTTVFVDAEGNLVGDAVIGVQKDMEAVFLAAVNQELAAGGKDEISLAE